MFNIEQRQFDSQGREELLPEGTVAPSAPRGLGPLPAHA
jgi:hypothetical protein